MVELNDDAAMAEEIRRCVNMTLVNTAPNVSMFDEQAIVKTVLELYDLA